MSACRTFPQKPATFQAGYSGRYAVRQPRRCPVGVAELVGICFFLRALRSPLKIHEISLGIVPEIRGGRVNVGKRPARAGVRPCRHHGAPSPTVSRKRNLRKRIFAVVVAGPCVVGLRKKLSRNPYPAADPSRAYRRSLYRLTAKASRSSPSPRRCPERTSRRMI